jgi:signal transduction histidine kinase
VTRPIPRWLGGALTGAALIAAITAVIALLEPDVPALGLGVLYLLAVVPIALVYGGTLATAASVASMVAFNFFFLAPRHTFNPGTSVQWEVLLAFLVSSQVVSQLAARSQREARRSARLANEQAALRRVATLVAGGVPPAEVFDAVARELGLLVGVDATHIGRYEPDGTATAVAAWSSAGDHVPAGRHVDLEGESVAGLVLRTGRAARMRGYEHEPGSGAALGRELGLRSSVGAPIVVDQRLWGVMIVSSKARLLLPADTEARLASFTELGAMAIANAESRVALAASRARVVAAADETRKRLERDLHDGIQQRLVSLGLQLRMAQAAVPPQLGELGRELSRVAKGLASAFDELREISRGIHPAILSEGGLEPALRVLCRRSAIPVALDLRAEQRLPEGVEVAAYYVVSEALTNAAKHAEASLVNVELNTHDAILHMAIRDDGVGGADPSLGSGLVGLGDRVEALDGTLRIISAVGSGTTLLIEMPFARHGNAPQP